jgi:hypothetical protein
MLRQIVLLMIQKKKECKALKDFNCLKCKFYKRKKAKSVPVKQEKTFGGFNLYDICHLFSKN